MRAILVQSHSRVSPLRRVPRLRGLPRLQGLALLASVSLLAPLAAVAGVSGCSPKGELPPEVDQFRSELADPAKHPVRKGMEIDEKALQSAFETYARSNRERFEAHFQRSLAGLPAREPPGEPDYAKLHEAEETMFTSFEETRGVFWALSPSAERTFHTGLSMFLPAVLHEGGFETARIGAWISFFTTAKPTLGKKIHGDDRLTLIADYGKADILVLTLKRGELGWMPVAFSWWRPSSA